MLSAGEEECRPPKAEQRSTGTEAQQEQHCSHPSRRGQSRQHPHVGCSVGRCGEHQQDVLQDRSCVSSIHLCRVEPTARGDESLPADPELWQPPKLGGPGQDLRLTPSTSG